LCVIDSATNHHTVHLLVRFLFRDLGSVMKHYIAVLAPLPEGGWRAHFPDLPACSAEGHTGEVAVSRASQKAADAIRRMSLNGGAPPPRSLEEIHADMVWASKQSFDWKTAIVRLVPVAGPD
jgi:predicted RNase H-like HicB family nuclease